MKPKTLAAAVALLAAAAAQATEFRSADTHNADDYPTVAAVKHMSELLEKKSGGKHRIKVFNKQALGSEKETIDQVKIGALDFTRVNVGPMNGICPLTQVPTMPFLFSSIAHMRKVLDGPVGDEILKSCESVGFIGLAFYDSGARSIYAKKPVRTVADAKGLKIRVQQSDLWVALVGAMGANPTPMPYGEVYTGLKTGLGNFAVGLRGTLALVSKQQTGNGDPFISNLGRFVTDGVVQRWRHRLSVDWERGPWTLTLSNSYIGSYEDQNSAIDTNSGTVVAPNRVKAYSLWDLSGSWSPNKALTLRAGIQNLADTSPPYSNQAYFFISGYDPSYTDPRGRTYYLSAQYRF